MSNLHSMTLGILGGGQLGRMLAQAAEKLDIRSHIFTPEQNSPASQVAWKTTVAPYEDGAALEAFAKSVDVITLEFENIPAVMAERLTALTPLHPSPRVLATCQHRVKEKEFVRAQGIGTAPFMAVNSREDLVAAVAKLGTPSILKTCTMGYDGKGQWKIGGTLPDVTIKDLILEGFVDFDCEISVIVARSTSGEMRCFPPVRNVHKNGILHQTHVPAGIAPEIEKKAIAAAEKLALAFDLIGLLAVEMFVTKSGEMLVNEMAPRAHNSGHWSLDACATSQFEQQARAVFGLPLGDTKILQPCVMTNLIGDEVNHLEQWKNNTSARIHLYGKTEARPGRKMGHVTILGQG